MILPVVFLATAVQSLVTYVEYCTFSANTSCAESPYCFNATDNGTCDRYMVFLQEWQWPELESWDTCITVSDYNEDTEAYIHYDMTVKCNDDGRSPCDGNLICAEICYFSNTSTCDGFCYEQKVTIPGMNDCDDYRANYTEMDVGFTNFGECFTYDDTFDVRITGCPNFSLSSTNDMNIGLIVGLTCAVLLIIIAILVLVNYRKSQKKAENLQKTIEAV